MLIFKTTNSFIGFSHIHTGYKTAARPDTLTAN